MNRDCPRCGMALWYGGGTIGRCFSPYCVDDDDVRVYVAPCGCYRVNRGDGSGGTDYGCSEHSLRRADGTMQKIPTMFERDETVPSQPMNSLTIHTTSDSMQTSPR
jgi:hypothetical protein